MKEKHADVLFGYSCTPSYGCFGKDDGGFLAEIHKDGRLVITTYIYSKVEKTKVEYGLRNVAVQAIVKVIEKYQNNIWNFDKHISNGSCDGNENLFIFDGKEIVTWNIKYNDEKEIKIENPQYYKGYLNIIREENEILLIFEEIVGILKRQGIYLQLDNITVDSKLERINKLDKENSSMDKDTNVLTPEWFSEKAKEFPTVEAEAKKYALGFKKTFAPEKLKSLSGRELLNTIFLNDENKNNLCHALEFDSESKRLYGGIGAGSSYKYGLFQRKNGGAWETGSALKSQVLSENEAIEIGTQIRDYLVNGADIILKACNVVELDDYQRLYDDLVSVTNGYVNRMWFLKYYAILYPELFPPTYSKKAQNMMLDKLNIIAGDNSIYRCGQMREYANNCGLSNVMFNHIFWMCYYVKYKEIIDEKTLPKPTGITPRTNKTYPLNFIIYGAPGTGKTYCMVEYALAVVDNIPFDDFKSGKPDRKANVERYKKLVDEGQIVFTTFHQNYGYEDFIQGLRPDNESETLSFKTIDGVFKKIADRALDDIDNNYVIVIDEINRANISKVFGELITLIEEDKRWGELNGMSVTLQSGDIFTVPNNLYIVGTMNSADKSISLIDAALRRRFEFIEKKPDSSLIEDDILRKIFENINEKLVEELDSTDLLVGHSYFMNKTENDLCKILNNNIIPLLHEYFYDNRKKVKALIEYAIDKSGAKVLIEDVKFGRLRVKDKVQ